jgi:hypothetical protein
VPRLGTCGSLLLDFEPRSHPLNKQRLTRPPQGRTRPRYGVTGRFGGAANTVVHWNPHPFRGSVFPTSKKQLTWTRTGTGWSVMQSSLQAALRQNGPSDQVEIASLSEPRPSDDELVARARSILRWKIRYNAVHVAARDGHVILSGHVFSELDQEAAEHTISKMTGVVTLTNRIVITSPVSPGSAAG